MSTDVCSYTWPAGHPAGPAACEQGRDGDNHDPSFHEGCKGVDARGCMLHVFVPGEAQHIIDARTVRAAAVAVADLAPPLAEALHLKAQDIFEAGEAELKGDLKPGVYAIRTANSVYLAEAYVNGQVLVLSRTSLTTGGWLDPEVRYSGWVIGAHPAVGSRFRFEWSENRERGPINVSAVQSVTRLP